MLASGVVAGALASLLSLAVQRGSSQDPPEARTPDEWQSREKCGILLPHVAVDIDREEIWHAVS